MWCLCSDLGEINKSLEEIVKSLSDTSEGQALKAPEHAKHLMDVLKRSRDLMENDIHDEKELNSHRKEREETAKKETVECPEALRNMLNDAEEDWKQLTERQSTMLTDQANELAECKKQLSEFKKQQSSGKEKVNNSLEEVKSSLTSQSENNSSAVTEKVVEMKTEWIGGLI